MGHYGQWENAAKYIDPRTDEETTPSPARSPFTSRKGGI